MDNNEKENLEKAQSEESTRDDNEKLRLAILEATQIWEKENLEKINSFEEKIKKQKEKLNSEERNLHLPNLHYFTEGQIRKEIKSIKYSIERLNDEISYLYNHLDRVIDSIKNQMCEHVWKDYTDFFCDGEICIKCGFKSVTYDNDLDK